MICYVMIMYIYAYVVLEPPAGCFMPLWTFVNWLHVAALS